MSILTIAIPTYNRQHKLERCLLQICEQIAKEGLHHQVGVLVSDNASTDDTAMFLETFQFSGVTVEMLYQLENLGFDGNVHELYVHCKSEYIWYFADDDILFDGAIARVVATIHSNLPQVLMFSFEQPPGSGIRFFDYPNDVYLPQSLDEQAELVFRVPKVTAYILQKKETVAAVIEESKEFLGTNFYFIALCYSLLNHAPNPRVAVISDVLAGADEGYTEMRFSADTFIYQASILRHPFLEKVDQAYISRRKRELYYGSIQALWAVAVGAWKVDDTEDYKVASSRVPIRPFWLISRPRSALQLVILKFRVTRFILGKIR
ncbi:MAG: hypothetical protein CL793_04755 [Chloroflexi bacterium]|nr:hypothetical protein [Chloroflexota bacterium]|tara:strand:- start:7450 stop:8409 length:960 start_codon:yes stop_codon:yes gene_type:complete